MESKNCLIKTIGPPNKANGEDNPTQDHSPRFVKREETVALTTMNGKATSLNWHIVGTRTQHTHDGCMVTALKHLVESKDNNNHIQSRRK